MNDYWLYLLGFGAGLVCSLTHDRIVKFVHERRLARLHREAKSKFDAEILSRWLQLQVIHDTAKRQGYVFVNKKDRPS